MYYETNIDGFTIRDAEREDCELIVLFIKKLATFEQMGALVTTSPRDIEKSLFDKVQAYCLIGESNGTPVSFAIYYHNYSILAGQANMHIEALYTSPEARGQGFGKHMLRIVAKIAIDTSCRRLDWACLKWNMPAINFYTDIGAYPLSDRDYYRLDSETLRVFAQV